MAPKTEADPKPDETGDGEPSRLDKIEAEQAEQKATLAEHGGMLTKILDRLPGKAPDGETKPDGEPKPEVTDIQGAVRREIAEANERAAAEAKAKGDADWRQSVDETLEVVRAEKAPREPQTGFKGRMQRAMFGADQ